MRTLRALPFLFITLSTFAQQRIGFDINTSGLNIYSTLSYQKVVASKFILNGGVLIGQLGYSGVFNKDADVNGPLTVVSPISAANSLLHRNGKDFELANYTLKATGISLQAGFGIFHEFSIKHGLKFQLIMRYGFVESELLGKYISPGISDGIEEMVRTSHFIAGVGPELNHTVRLSGRITFCYGLKFPYYWNIKQNNYFSVNVKDNFYGLQPELNFGITYVIGKCE